MTEHVDLEAIRLVLKGLTEHSEPISLVYNSEEYCVHGSDAAVNAFEDAIDQHWLPLEMSIAKVREVASTLVAELAAARAEVERLKGFEPCGHVINAEFDQRCDVELMHHNDDTCGLGVHDFVGGAFDADATTEGTDR